MESGGAMTRAIPEGGPFAWAPFLAQQRDLLERPSRWLSFCRWSDRLRKNLGKDR